MPERMPNRDQPAKDGLCITKAHMEGYLDALRKAGKQEETVKTYARHLKRLYDFLPEDKRMDRGTLFQWRACMMEQGYAVRTINVSISAANGLMEYLGRRELQLMDQIKQPREPQPELTKTEYLRLLQKARASEDEQTYLLIKFFASTGLSVQELPRLTVEAAEAGEVLTEAGVKHLPASLQGELCSFARRNSRASGPLFANREGAPLTRTYVNYLIQRTGQQAYVPEEKCSPTCLRRLYQQSREAIAARFEPLVDKALEQQMEAEQSFIGWEAAT